MNEFVHIPFGRPNTVKTYKSLFLNHIDPYVSPEEGKNFTQRDLETIAKIWLEKNLKPSTLNTLIIILTQYVEWCGTDLSTLKISSVSRKLRRSGQETETTCLTKEEAQRFMQVAKTRRRKVYLFCLLGLHAGLRRGEILGLKWKDFDALTNRITVRRSYRDAPTKSGKTRQVPISKALEQALEEEGYTLEKSENYVFEKILHHPNKSIALICEKAGIPKITVHGLRHTFATLALESGLSPKTVQRWLGHRNLQTTLNCYWKALPAETKMEFLPDDTD